MAKVLALSLLASASAHLCALSPLQRGGVFGAQTPAADVCGQGAAPCGALPAGAPVVAYLTGEQHRVHLLKNLDHFNKTAPGAFSVYLWDAAGKSTRLGMTPDSAKPSLTEYLVDITVPRVPAGNYTLQSGALRPCSFPAVARTGRPRATSRHDTLPLPPPSLCRLRDQLARAPGLLPVRRH